MAANARIKNSRIKAILDRCNNGSQVTANDYKENQPPLQAEEKTSCSEPQHLFTKNVTPEELVNNLMAAECPEISEVDKIFGKIQDTTTSKDVFDEDYTKIITAVNAALPLTGMATLVCNEVMPPMSLPPTLSLKEIFSAQDISEDKLNLSPTPTETSPSGDFSSDDSIKDKDYLPSDNSLDDNDESSPKNHRQKKTKNMCSNIEVNQDHYTEQSECLPSASETASTARTKGKNSSKRERKLQQKQEKRTSYYVKMACDEKCSKICSTKFTAEERAEINKKYWELSWKERRIFVKNSTAVAIPKRKITAEPKRAPRRNFTLKKLDGTNAEVCKIFFLTTLGFHKNNDTVLYNSINKTGEDKRGLHTKTALFDRKLITDHVESFHPLEPHYRREHAPLRRYLSCDLSITLMHNDFCEKYPSKKVSYELYRKHVKSMNISFTKLGNEECEECESYILHSKNASHNAENVVPDDCETCKLYDQHRKKYNKARALYESHKNNKQNKENIYFSVDLQKVIMLPRLDCFKKIIFCPRLTAFNLTFAPVGKITNEHKPLACIWHDGTSGRKQEDIMSCYYHFILQHRDVKNITIWMDNCSAQNKNWLLFSLMVYLINSDLIAADTITFQYFEPGHTFMSCDQFHHQVELAMKKKGKLYDFKDFTDCVASANLARVDVKTMEPKDFFSLPNYVSDRRIQTSTPRVYLKDIMQVCFQRKSHDILYKNDLDDENKSLKFMTEKYLKEPLVLKPEFKTEPKGIEKERKDGIIKVLSNITEPHKMQFWRNLPVCTSVCDENINKVQLTTRSTM